MDTKSELIKEILVGKESSSENVRVVVRVRPLSHKEEERGCQEIVTVDSKTSTVVVNRRQQAVQPKTSSGNICVSANSTGNNITGDSGSADLSPRTFTFDGVFGSNSTQAEGRNSRIKYLMIRIVIRIVFSLCNFFGTSLQCTIVWHDRSLKMFWKDIMEQSLHTDKLAQEKHSLWKGKLHPNSKESYPIHLLKYFPIFRKRKVTKDF